MLSTPSSLLLHHALAEQYHAALAMLSGCIGNCPDDLWVAGSHPRTFWRVAFHAAYFTHLYLGQGIDVYQPWPGQPGDCPDLWEKPPSIEPFELPEDFAPYTKSQILGYIAFVDAVVDPTVDGLDLEAQETGIPWYTNMSKLSHQLLNLRHVQGHVGQLSEILRAQGIDVEWISRAQAAG